MPTGLNVAIQAFALIVALAIRAAEPGWMLLVLVLFVFPLAAAVLPVGLALGTARREWLSPTVAVPFVVTAVALVATALVYPELDDQSWWVPILRALGVPDPANDTAQVIGNVALLAYVGALCWTALAVAITHAPDNDHEQRTTSG